MAAILSRPQCVNIEFIDCKNIEPHLVELFAHNGFVIYNE